ncbi:winged helix-turn-helix domain-containing tetratricopeptide repeat protein [Oceanibacterium hippocampi]|nr:winged helix-turn-helix domain-containing tetratricopeptide repeat protein [Oceanibacterium hippocampi]
MTFMFADCVLDPERRELTRAGGPVAIGPQVFDLLLYLVENRGRVVSKDDLLDAVWQGRIVSESTLASHINAVRRAIGDSGQEQRLVRTVARKGFRFVGNVNGSGRLPDGPAEPVKAEPDMLVLPDKPSIAVLPFLNLSGDAGQDYFADGVVEDIILALSRMRWLFVIARNSSFRYRGRTGDVKQVGRDLGVRYLLEGSVRRSAGRVRITGQLIDAGSGVHLWAERFESTLDDIFELQDQVAECVVGAIAPQIERAEIERARRKPPRSLDAHDHHLRGVACVQRGTRDALDEALLSFRRAIELDPDYAAAHGMAAWCHFWRKVNGWMTDGRHDVAEGIRLARRAVELGRNDAVALTRAGHVLGHLDGDLDGAVDLLDRALLLDPNLASAWFLSGFLKVWRGEAEDALERFARAMRLSPLDPEIYRMQAGTAAAHYLAGRFEAALSWAEKSSREMPSFLLVAAVIAACHAQAGRTEEARQAMRRLRELDPALRLSGLRDWLPIQRPEDLSLFAEGLRRAGLPE